MFVVKQESKISYNEKEKERAQIHFPLLLENCLVSGLLLLNLINFLLARQYLYFTQGFSVKYRIVINKGF